MTEIQLLRKVYRTGLMLRQELCTQDEFNIALDAVTNFKLKISIFEAWKIRTVLSLSFNMTNPVITKIEGDIHISKTSIFDTGRI